MDHLNTLKISQSILPERLVARDSQIKDVTSAIKSKKKSNIILYGERGTGKTAVIKHILKTLQTQSVFVNCKQKPTTHIIFNIIKEINPTSKIPYAGLSTQKYYEYLQDALNIRKSTILVFDKIDQLKSYDILYFLNNTSNNIIGISDNINFIKELNPNIFTCNLFFPPYTADQLEQILSDRADLAFNGRLDNTVVPLCTELAAEHGDARRALNLLETAVEIAEHNRLSLVDRNCVYQANEKLNINNISEATQSLPLQSRLILGSALQLVQNNSGIEPTTGELYTVYTKQCDGMDIKPLTRVRVSTLVSQLNTLGFINAPIVNRGRHGKTRLISFFNNVDHIEKILCSDPQVNFSEWNSTLDLLPISHR